MAKTPTAETKEIIINLLKTEPGKNFTVSDIKTKIKEKATQSITEGTLSGAIHSLINDRKSGIVNVSRGVYAYDSSALTDESDLTSKLINGVADSIDNLKNIADSINVLELEEEDIPVLQEMKKLISHLEEFNEKLLDTYGRKISE